MRIKKISAVLTAAVLICACSGKPESLQQHGPADSASVPFSQELIMEHTAPRGESYTDYLKIHKDGPVIPGLYQGAVPQGLAFDPESEKLYISNYMFNGQPSSVSVLSAEDGTFIKVLWLYNPDGTPHKGHVGGIAVSGKYVWISSGRGVYRINKDLIDSTDNKDRLKMETFIRTAVKGSFASYSDGILWVGEFASRDGTYSTPETHHIKLPSGKINHGWMGGYYLNKKSDTVTSENKEGEVLYPDIIISIPDEVQGAAFYGSAVVLSRSYGRRNRSTLVSYENPLEKKPGGSIRLSGGKEIPVYFLDEGNKITSLTAPPMTEGIAAYGKYTAVLFESGSDKYRSTALFPQGRIQLFPSDFFLQVNR